METSRSQSGQSESWRSLSFQGTGGWVAVDKKEGEEEEVEREEEGGAGEEEVVVASLGPTTAIVLAGLLCCVAREAEVAPPRSRAGVTAARSDEVPTRDARSIARMLRECCERERERG